MFERYTEKARRVIFFARYEASQFGSPYIETEHVLLGLLREDKALTERFLLTHLASESIRKDIEGHTRIRERVSTSVDLPLSNESKRVLAYAAEEAERLSQKHIGTEHLLLGLLREEKCFAGELLHKRGLRLAVIREELARAPHQPVASAPEHPSSLLKEFSRDLIESAINDEFDPLLGRTDELQGVLCALGSRNRSSVVLIGEAGVGKTAIVEGLAHRISDGNAPSFLQDKRILAVDLARMTAGSNQGQFAARMNTLVKEARDSANTILFIPELTTLVGLGPAASLDAVSILRPGLEKGDIQCVTEAPAASYKVTLEKIPWFARCMRTVTVLALGDGQVLEILQAQKVRYEKFHSVTYSDEALQRATQYAHGNPAKAIDVVDMAGTIVKLRQTHPPEEVSEVQKRIHFILHRMEAAIMSHEFEKARFYSDDEKKERENLRLLRAKYHIDEQSARALVRLEDMESAIARATT